MSQENQRHRGPTIYIYIDQHILNESKTSRKTLTIVWIDYRKATDMVPQRWILNCLKMYKITDQVVQFIEKTMQTWRIELTTGGKSLEEVKIQRGIFQGDALSPLLYVIAMMPVNHIVRICTAGYKLSKSQEKINHLMSMDIKLFAKNENELETLIQTENIQLRYSHRIWNRKMRQWKVANDKWQKESNYQIR